MSEKHEWPRFEAEIAPYFDAAAEDRLLIKNCTACGKPHHYPRTHCPHCFCDQTDWLEAAGTGRIYTYTVLRARDSAKVTAYVELDEGVRMLTNIVDCNPDELVIGAKVAVTFREQPDGSAVPFFTLAQE